MIFLITLLELSNRIAHESTKLALQKGTPHRPMATLISAENISLERSSKVLFHNQSFGVETSECIGVVGNNGSGKTSLLHLLNKTLAPDQGQVIHRNNIRIGMLAQSDAFQEEQTVEASVFSGMESFERSHTSESREISHALLADIDMNTTISCLSGGQRRRCDLARVLFQPYDVLLLDEPTNHLDMHTIYWLSRYLSSKQKSSKMAIVVVTHDRWFLDEITDHMWEVHDGALDHYEGGFSAYVQQRLERARAQEASWERHQNMLRKELAWLAHGAKARTSKPKFRIDAAYALIEKDPPLRNTQELKAQSITRLGKSVITLEHVSKSFGSTEVLHDISWLIGPGERIGILGNNGCGKSTLLQLMCGEEQPSHGTIKIGASVVLGIVDQHLRMFDDRMEDSCAQLLSEVSQRIILEGKAYTPDTLFLRLGFTHAELAARLQDLSGGQRRRLAILLCLCGRPNVLILDEPGNDLDCDMLSLLEDMLDTWAGTLILVSHDRHLMERTTDDLFSLIDGTITHLPGGVDEFMRRIDKLSTSQELQSREDSPKASQGKTPAHTRYQLKKQYDSLDRRLPKLKEQVEAIKEEMFADEHMDAQTLMELQEKLERAQKELSSTEDAWLDLAIQLEDEGSA